MPLLDDPMQVNHLGMQPATPACQLSLAILVRSGIMSTIYSESWDVNRHTARCTSPVFAVWQCILPESGWGIRKQRSREELYILGTCSKLLDCSIDVKLFIILLPCMCLC